MKKFKRRNILALLVAVALMSAGGMSYFGTTPEANMLTAAGVAGADQAALDTLINQQADNANSSTPSANPPVFRDASVHDPSVIKVDDTYYVFGSHLAAAKTQDLMQWDQIASGVSPDNPLFENVVEELQETFAWAQSDTLWAAM